MNPIIYSIHLLFLSLWLHKAKDHFHYLKITHNRFPHLDYFSQLISNPSAMLNNITDAITILLPAFPKISEKSSQSPQNVLLAKRIRLLSLLFYLYIPLLLFTFFCFLKN